MNFTGKMDNEEIVNYLYNICSHKMMNASLFDKIIRNNDKCIKTQ